MPNRTIKQGKVVRIIPSKLQFSWMENIEGIIVEKKEEQVKVMWIGDRLKKIPNTWDVKDLILIR